MTESSVSLLNISSGIVELDIRGPRDVAVVKYTLWHQSQVEDKRWKLGFQKACMAALDKGFDLVQIYVDQNPNFFIQEKVIEGVARCFVSDIEKWVKLSLSHDSMVFSSPVARQLHSHMYNEE
jgi:hypothetical protein